MRILFVCHRLPFPPNRGGKIRPFNLIKHLSRHHSVVVASLAHTQDELQAGEGLKQYCDHLIAEVVPNSVRWSNAIKALPTATPSSLAYFWSPTLRQRIDQAWNRDHFDAVWVHCAFAAQYVTQLRGAHRILDYGDIDSCKWFDYGHFRSFPLSVGYRFEAWKLRRYEISLSRRFDHCTVTTAGELQEFQHFNTGVPCTVIPNGVDFQYFQPVVPAPTDSNVIVFLGRMDYFPNVNGIIHFAQKVFPLILKRNPRAQLRIIGSNPVLRVRKLARNPAISVTGFVPDTRPHLRDAAVSVVPLRLARGTQNKMLESMAMGVPVVVSPEAARGVQAVSGRHILVAPDATSFADAICNLLENPELRAQLAGAAREHIIKLHDWSRSMQIVDQVLERAVQDKQLATTVR